MPTWSPGDPWPSGTAGGAASPAWGGYVRLWARAELEPGSPLTAGPHANDRLDAGNVLAGAPSGLPRGSSGGGLWVDLSCDVLNIDIQGGASSSEGILTKPDAATATLELADPDRIYDPLNGSSPFALGGRSRLVPGAGVDVFAEVVNGDDGTWSRHWLFTGSADSWGEDWTPHPSSRRARVIATGASKAFVNMNRPAQEPPVGAGDTVEQRVNRIVAEAGWAGAVEHGVGTVTLAPSALEGDGWHLLNSALDDELGFVYFTGDGALRWVGRDAWTDMTDPVLELGCGLRDVLVDASPAALDIQIRNAIFAGRDGAPELAPIMSSSSISRYGRFDYTRTDLGLADDTQAGAWARRVLELYAYPQIALSDVTAIPAVDPRSWELWAPLLSLQFVTDLVRVAWSPPDDVLGETEPIDTLARVVGFHHTITRHAWEVVLQLVDANALAYAGTIFTAGPHANDRLDSAFVYA